MYTINEAKVFVDSVDNQTVALIIDTGVYYTFTVAASAVMNDLTAGYTPEEILTALQQAGAAVSREELDRFVEELTASGILEEDGSQAPADRPAMVCAGLNAEEAAELHVDSFDDMAAYFQVDPIHEVDPEKGWPHEKEE